MPIKEIASSLNVLEAAKQRIRNVFSNGCKVYLSFSCGKDSACMSSLTYDLIRAGEIDPKQLTVIFIDEEGLYPSMVDAAMYWRKLFMGIGVRFLWFCLPFRQVSVINHLSASESWITWEPGKESIWMREPPPFAIMSSPYLPYPGATNYQRFCERAFADGIQMIGLRASESLTRRGILAKMDMNRATGKFYPIYDWMDTDVWLYIRESDLPFPEIYMRLYEAGVAKNHLRLCCFFGDMSTQGLRWVAETDPQLWERIQRREPNAYLVLLYWDSEMFRRSTSKRKKLESGQEEKDYKALCKDILFLNTAKYTIPPDTLKQFPSWQSLFVKTYLNARGIRTAYKKPWGKNSFSTLLSNERYIGVYMFADVRIEGGMPAIIDRALFEDVQEKVRRRKEVAGRRRDFAEYLLTGKAFCAKCGEPMIGISGTSRNGTPHYYYVCKTRREEHTCKKLNVRKEAAEREVALRLKSIILQPNVVEWMINNVLRFQDEARKQSDLASYQDRLVEVKRSLDNLVKAVEAGVFSQSTKARLDELEGEQRELQGMIAVEQSKIKTVTRDQIEYYLESFRDGDVNDPAYQKRLFKSFLVKVFLDDNYFRIVYNYADGLDTLEFPLTLEEIESADIAPECSYKPCSGPPSVPTSGTKSELVRNDRLALFYAAILLLLPIIPFSIGKAIFYTVSTGNRFHDFIGKLIDRQA